MSSTNKEFIKDLLFVAQYCKKEYNGLRVDKLLRRAAELIKNLQADKDALIAGQETLQKALAENDKTVMRLHSELSIPSLVQEEFDELQREYSGFRKGVEHSFKLVRTEAYKELAQKLKEQFNNLEFNVKTPRKTVKVEELQDQVNWILREVVIQTIDSVLNEYVEVMK